MDWAAFDAMTDEEVVARALRDPDNLSITSEDRKRMKSRPRAYIIRSSFRMTQEEFSEAFCIPLDLLRAWEEGRAEPDLAHRAYMKVIAVDPEFVKQALMQPPGAMPPSGARR